MIFSDRRHGSDFIIRGSLEYSSVHTMAATALRQKKKNMSVSSDMSKNIRVGRSGKSFFNFFLS